MQSNHEIQLGLPGILSPTSWELPENLEPDAWLECGRKLARVEGAIQWWLGDWWNFGIERKYGDGEEIADNIGKEYQLIRNYGWVANTFQLSLRRDISFTHHQVVAGIESSEERQGWLTIAINEGLSVNRLRAAIAHAAAKGKTAEIELEARKLGQFAVIYADPPWRYTAPPMGGSNRSIENHYPTMDLAEILAMDVASIAYEDAILFLWATAPQLPNCLEVVKAWGFEYKTNMVWDKVKIGMGYYVRGQHELLLICRRGNLPLPAETARPSSVVRCERGEHSEKPVEFYDIIDRMYPAVEKLELFSRETKPRPSWTFWGNQVQQAAE